MKKMTVFITAFALTELILVSCRDDKKNEASNAEIYSSDSIKEVDNYMKNENPQSDIVMTGEYAVNDGTVIAYDTNNDDKVIALKDWESFNILNNEMDDIEELDYTTTNERLANLNGAIENLGNSIPSWLKTEEVMEDVEDIHKDAIKEYNEEMKNITKK